MGNENWWLFTFFLQRKEFIRIFSVIVRWQPSYSIVITMVKTKVKRKPGLSSCVSYGQRDFRPVWFDMKEEATEIEFIFQPKTMTDVDMIAGTFEIIGFLDLEWMDTRLSWSSPEMKEMIFIRNII